MRKRQQGAGLELALPKEVFAVERDPAVQDHNRKIRASGALAFRPLVQRRQNTGACFFHQIEHAVVQADGLKPDAVFWAFWAQTQELQYADVIPP